LADLGLLLIRLMIGFVFIFYGTQKLFGWFGGYGIKGTGGWFELTGILFVLGFFLPLGVALITIIMVVSIVKVHGQKGF
jgi:putative oxidoreductase